ncbi:Rha family transcriptional regulator [Actinobacillus seminis]|uniref:Rha family transcriptional regulator n=1 Tax=Actinobacillus seminis TaxID=722 RepID=UPI003B95B4A3
MTTNCPIAADLFAHIVKSIKGNAMTTSRDVARVFGKEHKNILRDIENLECSADFGALNFELTYYKDEWNRRKPMYRMTRDGFSFLVMGFRGKKAAEFKERFIQKFNEMEKWINSRQQLSHNQHRMNDAIQYRETITGKQDKHIYARENNLIYVVALGKPRKQWLQAQGLPTDDEIRQHLTAKQIELVDMLTSENATMIKLGLNYEIRKAQLTFSATYFKVRNGLINKQGKETK